MDEVTLNKEQLQKLVCFISSRGFKDPLVVMDILDHFSCKVEEVLNADLQLSLEAAMQQAHYSFGIKGFQPLAEASKGVLMKKCTAAYKQVRSGLFSSPLQLGIIVIVGFLFFCGYYWAAVTNHLVAFMDCNLFMFIVYLLVLGCGIFSGVKFTPYDGLHEAVNAACIKTDRFFLVFMLTIAFVIPAIFSAMPLVLLTVLRTIAFSYVLVWQWSKYLTVNTVIRSFKTDIVTLRALLVS